MGILLCLLEKAHAQNDIGKINGTVKDSIHTSILSSATVTIFKKSNGSLVAFCIPNNFGQFSLSKLPLDDTLKIQITHIGYLDYQKLFVISKNNPSVDFGFIYMFTKIQENDEVVVTAIPPVRMNGDTLEFNPRAFKMDPTATTEDLFRRLPGFTIWSDGGITFNGKKIKALLVDGKPFLGGTDITAATQNLPKDVLDKVQIYKQKNDKNPLDSTLYANIKLKTDKKKGVFGKEAVGVGSRKRYAADAMLTGYNKRAQLSLVGISNNINKIATNVDELIKASSFQGESNNIEYQTDFSLAGLNTHTGAVGKLQYDFILDPKFQHTERLNADYLMRHNKLESEQNVTSSTFLDNDTVLTRHSNIQVTNSYTNQDFNCAYKSEKKLYDLHIDGTFNSKNERNNFISNDQQEITGRGLVSTSNIHKENNLIDRKIQVNTLFQSGEYWQTDMTTFKRIPDRFIIKYTLAIDDKKTNGTNQSLFQFTNNPAAIRQFNRLYAQQNGLLQKHKLFLQYTDFRQLIFGRNQLGGINISLFGNLNIENGRSNDIVFDFNDVTKFYEANHYLTNLRNEKTVKITPGFKIQKQVVKGLTNRFNRYFNFQIIGKNQSYLMKSDALQVIQNYQYRYSDFLPEILAEYSNHQYGSHEEKYRLKFERSINYPILDWIAPLTDSANLWVLQKGNSALRPELQNEYSAEYSLESRKPRNPYLLEMTLSLDLIKEKISDSVFYDETGKVSLYKVNAGEAKNVRFSTYAKKSLTKDGINTVYFSAAYNFLSSTSDFFTNGDRIPTTTVQHNLTAEVGYTFKKVISAKYQQSINSFTTIQSYTGSSKFYSNNLISKISLTIECPKNFVWGTNATYSKNMSTNLASINFIIWNASATYRFLKANQAEIKISALDLLRQNNSVINLRGVNMQTFGYNNVLQQYFMLTLAYYPRKF